MLALLDFASIAVTPPFDRSTLGSVERWTPAVLSILRVSQQVLCIELVCNLCEGLCWWSLSLRLLLPQPLTARDG